MVYSNIEDSVRVINGLSDLGIGDGHWLTISDYCEKWGHRIEKVLAWISRGTVKPEEVVTVGKLNDLKLIRDIDYSVRVRKYGARKGGVEQ